MLVLQFIRYWIALGLNISLKISGLFTFAWVGILTCVQLWEILGDLRISIWQFIKHLVLRVVAFIMVPLTIYCSVFYIHFENLPNEGPGSGFLHHTSDQLWMIINNNHYKFYMEVLSL